MANRSDSNSDEALAAIAVMLLVIAAVVFVVLVVIPVTLTLGGVLGGGVSVVNYVSAFIGNVRPEGDPNGWIAKGIMITLGLVAATLVAVLVCQR
jgi:hypothetical protein